MLCVMWAYIGMTLGHRPDIYVTTTACSHTYGISSKQRTKLYRLSQIAGTYSLLATQYEYYATVIRYSGCTSQAVRHHDIYPLRWAISTLSYLRYMPQLWEQSLKHSGSSASQMSAGQTGTWYWISWIGLTW